MKIDIETARNGYVVRTSDPTEEPIAFLDMETLLKWIQVNVR